MGTPTDLKITPHARRRLEHLAHTYALRLIYLFGSQVDLGLSLLREGASPPVKDPFADIDVGVVFSDGIPPVSERPSVYANLYHELQAVFHPHPLDLVFLEENHSVFQAGVLRGACIYRISKESQFNYEEEIARRAADFRPVLDRFLDEILEEV